MIHTIIGTIITFVVSSILGYCVSLIKNYQKKLKEKKDEENKVLEEFKKLKQTQLMDMRNDLSNKFFVYDALEEVEDYLVISFREKCEKYFDMGGNNWIHPMYNKSFKWKMKQTGYLK
jgi:hypothetical protein